MGNASKLWKQRKLWIKIIVILNIPFNNFNFRIKRIKDLEFMRNRANNLSIC